MPQFMKRDSSQEDGELSEEEAEEEEEKVTYTRDDDSF